MPAPRSLLVVMDPIEHIKPAKDTTLGMLLADALTSAFSSGASEVGELAHEAGWGEPAPTDVEPPEPQNAGYEDAGYDDPGFDAGGDDSYDV